MRILYGVVGEGMGHATRSAVILTHLLDQAHELRVVVSGQAHGFLKERFAERENFTIDEIHGLTLRYFGNRLYRADSLFWNLRNAPKGIRKNVKVYRKVAEDGFKPELVISDFESWAALYALNQRLPVISIDNMQVLNRCAHDRAIKKSKGFDFRLARLAVKVKVPRAYHYLVTSFFYPPVRRKYTTLVPPILRPELLELKREPRQHVLVYQRAVDSDTLTTMLKKLPHRFRVYGAPATGEDGNVSLRPFSGTGFLEDLRTAKAVITGGGFSSISEAVSLKVPVLSVPIEHQYEQELNARYVEHLGYGRYVRRLDADQVEDFLARAPEFEQALAGFQRHDNSMLFRCLDEAIENAANKQKRPTRLSSTSMGSFRSKEKKDPKRKDIA